MVDQASIALSSVPLDKRVIYTLAVKEPAQAELRALDDVSEHSMA